MSINEAGLSLIKASEGLSLKAYKCPAGVWTIGFGTTGKWIKEGVRITLEKAEELLREDVDTFYKGVEKAVDGIPTTENQMAAMASLAYNIGLGAFGKSSVLRYHRAGKRQMAAAAFLLWVRGGGKKLPGLVTRRAKERALYLS